MKPKQFVVREFGFGHAQNQKATLAIYYDFHKPQLLPGEL